MNLIYKTGFQLWSNAHTAYTQETRQENKYFAQTRLLYSRLKIAESVCNMYLVLRRDYFDYSFGSAAVTMGSIVAVFVHCLNGVVARAHDQRYETKELETESRCYGPAQFESLFRKSFTNCSNYLFRKNIFY